MKQVKEYLCNVKWVVAAVILFTFMAHGAILFSQGFGIDTDSIIAGWHNFDLIGRQGLVWLARLLGLDWFNLYYAQVLALFFMVLAPVSFGFTLSASGGGKQAAQ